MAEGEVIPTLTQDERAVLMIAAQGKSLADLGEHSRWHVPINSLIKKGFLLRGDQFNNFVTDAGRRASESVEDAEVREAFRKVREHERGPVETAPYGPSVVNGKLFFKLLDGSTVTCNCIQGRVAEQIVEACKHR